MNQQNFKQVEPTTIEMLKLARNQVVFNHSEDSLLKDSEKEKKEEKDITLNAFAKTFVQKIESLEQEKAAVDEELAKIEKNWSELNEKKTNLEKRKKKLLDIKNQINVLDEEMADFLEK